jgi:hypothetical protein
MHYTSRLEANCRTAQQGYLRGFIAAANTTPRKVHQTIESLNAPVIVRCGEDLFGQLRGLDPCNFAGCIHREPAVPNV